MVFALHSKVVQNLAAAVKFVHSIIKTLICCAEADCREDPNVHPAIVDAASEDLPPTSGISRQRHQHQRGPIL